MRKLIAVAVLGALALGLGARPAQASGAADAALGLGAFAVFNQLFGVFGYHERVVVAAPYPYYPYSYYPSPVVYASPPVVYTAPPVVYAPPPPAIQREVVYPHGRYVLQGDGVTVAYRWVWIPNPPPPPPAPPAGAAAPAPSTPR